MHYRCLKAANYIRKKDLGLDKENVMIIPMRDTAFINRQLQPFKNALEENPSVRGVASSALVPPLMANKVVFQIEKEEGMVELAISFSIVDHEFIDVMGIEMVQGRNFDRSGCRPDTGLHSQREAVKAFGGR
jgi:putative ABC transport system permease protein